MTVKSGGQEFTIISLESMLAAHNVGLPLLPNVVCSIETWREYTRQVYGEHSVQHIESYVLYGEERSTKCYFKSICEITGKPVHHGEDDK